MPYITDAVLASAVAASQTLASAASLPAYFNAIIPTANLFAYNRIRNVLFDRGYTAAQLDLWDERTNWNEAVGVTVAFWKASKGDEDRGEAFRREYVQQMEDLVKTRIVIAGVITDPAGSMGRVGHGDFATSTDLHSMDDEL